MTLRNPSSLALLLLAVLGCRDKGDPNFGDAMDLGTSTDSGGTDGGSDTDGGVSTDSGVVTDSGGDGGGAGGDSGGTSDGGESAEFDGEGSVVTYEDEEGRATVNLADLNSESNQGQEFYAIVVNEGSSALGYTLRTNEGAGARRSPRPSTPAMSRRATPFRSALQERIRSGTAPMFEPEPPEVAPPFTTSDVGVTKRVFHSRNDIEDDSSYAVVDAILWAVGDSVAIWVDEDVAIDWDYTCDGAIDETHARPAYGFDNCDLQTIADIVDANVIPNVRTYFGDESDVNGDGLVSVVVTPVLNEMTLGSEDEDDWASVVGSYADPEVDLRTWDAESNPGSDEQEVMYVFAPDPYGFYNPYATVDTDQYTAMELAAQIGRAFYGLVSYNQHVVRTGDETADTEEAWLREGLAAVAVDLTGFGAVMYDECWDYLDATHLVSLVSTTDEGAISTEKAGAQYLFVRWLVDAYGEAILEDLTQTSNVGVENVEQATGEGEGTFGDIVVNWHIALLTTGVLNSDGDPLVSAKDYVLYSDATSASAPVNNPAEGDLYGANGYQIGVNVRGINRYMEGGTTNAASEVTDRRVQLANVDHSTSVTGFDFYGYAAANYGVHVVRVTDIPFDAAELEMQGSSSDFLGAVVRWRDPAFEDLVVEDVFSSTDANNLDLAELPTDGSPIYAVGEIGIAGTTNTIDSEGTETRASVEDTDRWLIDLGGRAPTDVVRLAIQLDRHFEDTSGNVGLSDPWFAVLPLAYVPAPSVADTNSGACSGATTFEYPVSMLDHLYYQMFLSSVTDVANAEFDPCGVVTGVSSCSTDWDQDGVLDADEPAPTSFLEQVQVMQCTEAGGDSSAFSAVSASDIFDTDSVDEDDDYSYDRTVNLGGRNGEDGEEAYLEVEVSGMEEYVLIVGGGSGGAGVYEISIVEMQ
jgi:hypothetical protein